MGRRGPQPTPTAVLRMRGSRLGARRAETEVSGTAGDPLVLPCVLFCASNKKFYDDCVDQIKKLGVMREQDGIAVSWLAHEIALSEHAAIMVEQTGGEVINGKGGIPMINPWSRARREARDSAWRILTHFGLTASSRVNLQGQKDTGDRKAKDIASLFKFGS